MADFGINFERKIQGGGGVQYSSVDNRIWGENGGETIFWEIAEGVTGVE